MRKHDVIERLGEPDYASTNILYYFKMKLRVVKHRSSSGRKSLLIQPIRFKEDRLSYYDYGYNGGWTTYTHMSERVYEAYVNCILEKELLDV